MASVVHARHALARGVLSPRGGNLLAARWLNLHEYQSKSLMQKFNVAVQKFKAADNAVEAEKAARELSL